MAVGAALLATSVLVPMPAASAAPPPGQDFNITQGDLEYIIKQVEIAEAHAERTLKDPDASPLCGNDKRFDVASQTFFNAANKPCVGNPLLPHGLRTVDGRWNNLMTGQDGFGTAQETFPRLVPAQYADAEVTPPFAPGNNTSAPGAATSYKQTDGFVYDSAPRTISNLIVDQTTANPAAAQVAERVEGAGPEGETNTVIPDIATDEGLSASATSLFTIFGQFFDHGLDLVSKGGNGTVVVPLKEDDPLYTPGGRTNFLTLTRATIDTGKDGSAREHVNRTTPFVDLNQTYGSHASHHAFMREYEVIDGKPVPTGRMLDGADGGLPTWKDVKDQARTVLGIELDDFDVLDVPLLATDPYGHLLLSADGNAQLATQDGLVEGNRTAPVATNGLTANASFLDDIAHGATPKPDTTGTDGVVIPGYDNDALDAHYVAGDGRVNENIGLTAVHHVFHSEHNRLQAQIEAELVDMPAELRARFAADGFWDEGERSFQAARFLAEMQYQHLVFEEFARRIQPEIDPVVLNENSYQPDVNSSIRAEFAHSVYRFGHSMLRENIPVQQADGTMKDIKLLDAFLKPTLFAESGANADDAAGNILKGLANQTANGVDEFVTDTLRNQLLGLPLDLATINMARARETGTPGLQAARKAFFAETRDPQLKPYTSWEDFRLSMKNPESIVNFIAAYGNHPSVTGAETLAAKRAAGVELSKDKAFMEAPAAETGLDGIDLWMGGLAEKPYVFGGMLGATFNHVFEKQLEDLQNGDRFYYLSRNLGNSLFHALEANSLSQIVQRNTTADRVPHDVFAAPQLTFSLDDSVTRQAELNAAGLTGAQDSGWRFSGEDHIVVQDTDQDSTIRTGLGDDSVWGKGGNDTIEGDDGADALMGGNGDDVITDIFGDDRLQGEGGNDALNGGPGLGDLLFGGSGQDFIVGGHDASTTFGGLGNDFILGGTGRDNARGDEGDDWIDGGTNADLLVGDLSNTAQNDAGLYHGGHDVLVGRTGNNDHDAEAGDDVMIGGPGTDRFAGMLGFDWVTYDKTNHLIRADLDPVQIVPGVESAIVDRYDEVEAFSGFDGDDIVRGVQNRDAFDNPEEDKIGYGHRLTQAQLDRVEGLRELLGGGEKPVYALPFLDGEPFEAEDMNNNVILGGGGSDLIEPRAGENFIDGDAWLDTNIVYGEERSDKLEPFVERIFDRTINPKDLKIERRIQTASGGADTVVYSVDRADATLTTLPDGMVRVETEGRDPAVDVLRNVEQLQFNDAVVDITNGVDGDPEPGIPLSVSLSPTTVPVVDGQLTATVEGPVTAGSEMSFELQVIRLAPDGTESATTTQSNTTGRFTITEAEAGFPVQVVATVTTADGAPSQYVSERTAGTLSTLKETVTAPSPGHDPAKKTVTIPDVTGVTYSIDGTRKAAGTYPATTLVTVKAEAASENYIVEARTWTFDLRSAVTPTKPVFSAAGNTVRIPAKTGVDYYVNGARKATGTHKYGGTGTVTAKASSDSYTLSGTTSWTFDNRNAVTPTKPVFSATANTVKIPSKAGVIYYVNGVKKPAGTLRYSGAGTVTAKASSGMYRLSGTTSWRFDNRQAVTPTKPVFSAAANTVKIPSKAGVVYYVNGVKKPAGTHRYTGAVTVTTKASTTGYKLAGTQTWSARL
ncbi:peroxidase family protein [Micrococcus sp. TA1]|uniref:peroxidase family protein n=1 Tax=Micrococcus sp. TA1 TaxID=681627 RepID=UPI0016109F0A|nr:peroxidase family protein [Micrococcus sp. TA1]MBB5748402.1 Ca2+-binding RTX toxin-like protein [Micrococcus sp. TA1]